MADWDILPDGRVVLPPYTHVHRWGPWSEWKRREPPYESSIQRVRVCLEGCGVDELNTEYAPEGVPNA